MAKPLNVMFILSEHHNPAFAGHAGHPYVRTPNLDRLAEQGTRFEYTYCASPACVPSRGALWSGRHCFETGVWCNATPWDGASGGWSYYLRDRGVRVATIGKLDFQPGVDHGMSEELQPLHRKSLDIHSLYREQPIIPRYLDVLDFIRSPRRREDYSSARSDADVVDQAVAWLRNRRPQDRPWLLNVNFLKAHPVWGPPPAIWDYYDPKVKLEDLPTRYSQPLGQMHPYFRTFAEHQGAHFTQPDDIRRAHVGFCSFVDILDQQVGALIRALEQTGQMESTLIVYSTDHGAAIHAHGCWGILNLWEDTARVPLIIRHPDGARGHIDRSPTHHHDVLPTICEALGLEAPPDFRGHSLIPAASNADPSPRREFAICEIHANGWPGSSFAVSNGRTKYVECVGERPAFFDLQRDPQELHDLVVEQPNDPAVLVASDCARRHLCQLCSPRAVDVRAKQDQARLRDRLQQTGQLAKELAQRGYEPTGDRLVPRRDVLDRIGASAR
jgi:choline-sulfatase